MPADEAARLRFLPEAGWSSCSRRGSNHRHYDAGADDDEDQSAEQHWRERASPVTLSAGMEDSASVFVLIHGMYPYIVGGVS